MRCPQCRFENREGVRFCEECGAKLELTCAACGAAVPPGRKFCGNCGQALSQPAGPASGLRSPESYTPKHLAERILTSKAALEGERKQVTILFADLKGSMELLADRDPEEARKILDPVLELMMEAVHRYEGTVNQVMGDGIMALFGAPLAQEDHAVRACYAALHMQEAVKRHVEEVRRAEGIPIQIRVGLNSGEVVVRSIGSDLRMDYSAVGQTAHLAARMEQMASPGTILLTPETLVLAEGFVQVASLGPMRVKGLPSPVEVFELTGANPVRSRLHAAAARGLTRFVGRDTEIELLRQVLERASGGRGQVVAVVGEPGVGKSRLAWEFTHSHRTRHWLVLEAASVSYGKATTYFPVIELLRAYFHVELRDDGRKIREKVTGKLLSLDRALEPTLCVFLSLLDVSVEDLEWARLDPPQRRTRTLDALKRLLLRESQVQPVLLVFEDLHWIDSETQAFLDTLVESLPTARVLLLVNYRPEYTHAWGSKTYYQQLRLDALPSASAEELLDDVVGQDPGVGALKRLLIERTLGNPFFLEESVRALVETNALLGERGAYRLGKHVDNLELPATVQAILAARIDRLTPGDKRLLQAAAVIGKDVPFVLLQAIAEEPEERLREDLARLQAAEFLYEARLFPDLEYTFKHALTHEVAYGGLLRERRQSLHARIVEAIERLHPDRIGENAEQLAHHALRGELWSEAVSYLREAATRAFARAASKEAVTHAEQALAALQHLPETADTLRHAVDLRLSMEVALMLLGQFHRGLERLREAQVLAERLDDRSRLARVLSRITYNLGSLGDLEGSVRAGEFALSVARDAGDLRAEGATYNMLARANYALGNYREAVTHSRQNERVAPETAKRGEPTNLAFTRVWLILSLTELGEFEEGVSWATKTVRLAETEHGPHERVWAYFGAGRLHLVRGAYFDAIAVLERGLPLFDTGALRVYVSRTFSTLGAAYALAGHVPEALPPLERAAREGEAIGFRYGHSLVLAHLAEGYRLAGRLDEAASIAGKALALAREQGERGHQAWILRLITEIAVSRGLDALESTEVHYHEALSLAKDLHMRPLIAHCHLGLGKLYRRTGKRQQAQEHFTTATTLYREMGMTYWSEKAERDMNESP